MSSKGWLFDQRKLLKQCPSRVQILTLKPAFNRPNGPDISRGLDEDGPSRDIRHQRLTITQVKVDLQALHGASRHSGWICTVGTPRTSDDRLRCTAGLKHNAVLSHVAGKVLLTGEVKGVEPDDGVGAYVCMAPVPLRGAVNEWLVAPVLIVIANAVGEVQPGIVAETEVDGRRGVRDGVRPANMWDDDLCYSRFVEIAGVVSGCKLMGTMLVSLLAAYIRSMRRALLQESLVHFTTY